MTIALAKLNVEANDKVKSFNDFHVIDALTEIDFGNVTVSFFLRRRIRFRKRLELC